MAAKAPSFLKHLFWCLVMTFSLYVLETLPYVGKLFKEITPGLLAFMFSFLAYDFLFDQDSGSGSYPFRYFSAHLLLVLISFFVFEYISAVIVTKHRYQRTTYAQAAQSIDKYVQSKVGRDGMMGYALWQLKREVFPKDIKTSINDSFVKGNDKIIDAILKYIPHRIVSWFSIKKWAGAVFWAWYYIGTLVIGVIGGFLYKESTS